VNKISVQNHNGVTRVTLNRPETKNAFDPEMIQEITHAFLEIAKDSSCRVVVLSGSGSSFSAGADLNWMKSMASYTMEQNRQDAETLFAMFEAIRMCPAPVVGQMQGHVMGGAIGLAAVCDVAAAEASTVFCFSEVRLGLAPAVISSFVLEKVQRSLAQRYMLTGETFLAADAKNMGLVHHVGDEGAVEQFVQKIVQAFLANGPQAVRESKKLLRFVSSGGWNETERAQVRGETTRVIAERRVSSEGQEGLKSFFEKRSPSWKKE
jgi:methylglutaconyl-CoA hydratase